MRFISSLCWVKKGCGKTPSKIKLDKDEMKALFSEFDKPDDEENSDEVNEDSDGDNNKICKTEEEEIKEIDKKYNLDDYDNEDDELKMEKLNSLACFASNTEDKFLNSKDDDDDESDQEDIQIKKTDNLIVCGTLEENDSSLNIFVYNDVEANFYIHHDILLSSVPLCLEWLDFDPTEKETAVNYIAVGTLNPWIEIWDLDIMDSLEPEFVLGSNKPKKNKKLKTEGKKQKIIGHTDAVLDLSYNRLNINILASGSVDKTIVLWDLEELKQAIKIKNHSDKVQSLEFHPVESFSLLAGSADQTVVLYDCRNPKTNKKTWEFENEIEKVLWNHKQPNDFICCDSNGNVHICDIRKDKPILTKKAHEESTAGISLSSNVPGLLLSTGDDEFIRVWDLENGVMELIHEKKLKIGSLTCNNSSPDNGFVFTFGGSKSSSPEVWDVREIKEIRNRFFPRMNLTEKEEEDENEENEEKKDIEPKLNRRKERALKFKQNKINKSNNIKSKKTIK